MKTKSIVMTGLMAAIICVISLWQIPIGIFGVGATFQTFAIALAGYTLGIKRGGTAVLVYIALGAVGIPVFSGFQGGFSVLLGPTGGFIFGFLPMVILCALGKGKKTYVALLWGALGLMACHIFGTVGYALSANCDYLTASLSVSVPYLIKDLLLVMGGYFISKALQKSLKI